MIKEEDVLSYTEFLSKYKNELRNNNLSQEIIDNMVATLLSEEDYIISEFKFKIRQIYVAIISIKYLDSSNHKDIGKIYSLIKNINSLNLDWRIIYDDYYNMNRMCNEVYIELSTISIYSKIMQKEMEEEFKYEHLLDAKYHLNNFRIWGKDDKEFIKELDKELWRII